MIGVVADVRHSSLEEAPQRQMYVPSYEVGGASGAYVAVRSVLPPSTVASDTRGVMKGVDPNLARADVYTMGDLMSEASAHGDFKRGCSRCLPPLPSCSRW